jgi:hypothetical protein
MIKQNAKLFIKRGYCVSTIGLNEKKILNYIKYQERDDKGQIELDLDKSI